MNRPDAPLLSLIVPQRNHERSLPTLLDSVLAQTLRSLEVIIVDDASDPGCDDVVRAYRGKGLDVSLLRNPAQIGVLRARLQGIEAARADIIAFADADDLLWGETALEEHAGRMQRENADIVHFGCVLVDNAGAFHGEYVWALPFASRCEGRDIFARFVDTHHMGWPVWNKLYRKSLCMRAREDFEQFAPGRCEDMLMNAIYMFHAEKYVGSNRIGYGYRYVDKRDEVSLPRVLALRTMIRDLLPFLQEKRAEESSLEKFSRALWHNLCINAGRMCVSLVERHGDQLSDAALAELLNQADAATWVRILVAANKMNAEKIQRIAQGVLY